ncbi:hypothetical protein RB595_002668 [Gaeumannomyces hyphopodioides]
MASASAKNVEIPAFEATALDSIAPTCRMVRSKFESHETKDVEWRKVQLRKLYWAIEDFTPKMVAAMMQDFGKSEYEVILSEIMFIKNDCMYFLDKLDEFTKDESAPDVPLTFRANNIKVRKDPLGTVLIIAPYNYPIQLLLCPLVGAIAAGCTAVIKPSELTPAVAMVTREMIESRLDQDAYAVVNGAVPETSALLDEKWDKIFYTGGLSVGKIVAKKAAESLTPVTLELGGMNPAFVTRSADLRLAAKRLLWGKTMNAGQVCLSQNYVLVERPAVDEFIAQLKRAHTEFFPDGARGSDLSKVVNERHWLRLKAMLDESKGRIVVGGQMDRETRFMEPTAVLVDSIDDSMMTQESFGPIFAIMPFDDLATAIKTAARVDPTPLALYTFGNDTENSKVLREMKSGGASINDSFAHGSIHTVAFGGVGTSGTGSYRGKASFDTFTHFRIVAKTPSWMESLLRPRYMPYRMSELRRLAMLTAKRPNFDRNGKVIRGLAYWVSFVLTLGGGGFKVVVVKWLALAVVAFIGIYTPARLVPIVAAPRH